MEIDKPVLAAYKCGECKMLTSKPLNAVNITEVENRLMPDGAYRPYEKTSTIGVCDQCVELYRNEIDGRI